MSQLAPRLPSPAPFNPPPRPPRRPPAVLSGSSERPEDRPGAEGFLTPHEFAKLLNVSRAKFFKMKAAGKLPRPVNFGRLPRWHWAKLRAWFYAGCPDPREWEDDRDTGKGGGR